MQDNRRYVRMGTVFPVEFTIVVPNVDAPERLLQGFTCNVSDGGMCIEFKSFGKEVERRLNDPFASLKLTINPAFSRNPILAHARIVWLKKEGGASSARYLIGVAYEAIDPAAQKRLIGYARRALWIPRFFSVIGLILLAALVALAAHDRALVNQNLKLAQEVREGAAKRSRVAGELVTLAARGRSLEAQLGKSHEREAGIRGELERIQHSQEEMRQSYRALEETGREGSEKALEWMSQWIASHRNVKTGLVVSYEGDPSLDDTAFSYDQALAVQALLLGKDPEKAAGILSFFESRAQKKDGAFFNAYGTSEGDVHEMIVRTGPNLWLGIAALQYERAAADGRFLPMARRLGDWALRLQDGEGGLPGGPGVSWYSTEHNLDAYAFFGMLADLTGDARYIRAQENVLAWLKKYAYSNKSGAVNRGKGDATIATDTFAWSIAAVGPSKLLEMGFDPEEILDYAEQHCEVRTSSKNPSGETLQVRGFDFAKAQHLSRGGVISTEWTAQMVVSYQVLARHFKAAGDLKKEARYSEKADFYFNELQKMLIVSPSRTGQGRGCLPYASADNVDTGHGWRTPNGSSTGSVAGTAYGLFAGKGYNPFELPKKMVRQAHHKGADRAGL